MSGLDASTRQAIIDRRHRLWGSSSSTPKAKPRMVEVKSAPEAVAIVPAAIRALDLPKTRGPYWLRIVNEVAKKHNIDVKSILSEARSHHIVVARNECFWRIRREVFVLGEPMSLPQIGKRFGKDHSSVLHGVRKHQALVDKGIDGPVFPPDEKSPKPVNPGIGKRVGCATDSVLITSRPLFENEAVS